MMGIASRIKKLTAGDNKRVLTNFLSLSVLQGTNLLLPLVTFPYLVRVLGIEKFGLIAFALATVGYFEIITDYGFDFSATRQISIHRKDTAKVTNIYSSVLTIKVLLSLLSLVLLTIIVFSFNKFHEFLWVYYFTFGRVVGKSLFPVWFFQGMEKMKITTYLNIFAKAVFTAAIFIFVREETDFILVPIFNSLGFLAAGIVAILQIRYSFGIRFNLPSRSAIVEHLVDGWHIFLSRIYVNIYTTTNTFLLGVFTNNIIVGYYSVAAKIIEALNSVFIPAHNALYPYMSKLFHDNVQKFYKLIKQMNLVYFGVAAVMFVCSMVFGRQIIILVNGSFDENVYLIYSVLAFKTLMAPYGPFFTMILINQDRKAVYLKIVKYTFVANIILIPLAIHFFSGVGMASAVLVVGLFHILLFLKYKLNPGDVALANQNVLA